MRRSQPALSRTEMKREPRINRALKRMAAGLWLCFALAPAALGDPAPEALELFNTKVLPILKQRCYECHSAEADKIKGGLRVDTRQALMKGGDSGSALVPGEPEASRIIQAVRYLDEDLQMPPKEKLPEAEIAILEEWVRMGAPDPRSEPIEPAPEEPALWSTQPLMEPTVPKVENGGWVKDPLDAFVLAKLEANGLTPAPPAGKAALIRRAYFDVTGLPPTRNEVEAFLADASADAFAKVVDRLLDSPHFGERWGRHWLDLARYAESNGLDFNNLFENAWRYRDYVINAYNSDKPYDQFILEQIAGDLMPSENQEDLHENWIATGFLLLGPKNFIEPNREKLIMDVVDEQIDVTSRAFLGLTVSCARCHDHKFDPIPTRDYYAIAGIFRSTFTLTENRAPGPNGVPWSRRPLGTPEQAAKLEAYNEKLNELQRDLQLARQMRQTLPGGIDSALLDGIVLDNSAAEVIGSWARSNYSTNFVDKDYLHDGNERSGKGKKMVRFRPEIPQDGFYEIRLAYTPRFNRATNVPVRVSGKSERTIYLNQTVPPKYDEAFESLGVFDLAAGTNTVVEILTEGTKGFVVVDALQLLPKDVRLAARLKKMPPPAESDQARMMMMAPSAPLDLEYAMQDLRASAPPPMPMAMAVKEGEVRNARIRIRGEVDRLGAEVPRGFLSAVEIPAEPPSPEQSGRLELAHWIASPDNPLTSRVEVNRIWLHLLGKGLVGTPDNFGFSGEPPSHPELLDYLASEFVREGWSRKRLIRRILLSATYRMSTRGSALARGADPDNNLLWRMNPKRLEPEPLRDAMLAINGSLDRTVGGNEAADSPVTNPPRSADPLQSNRRSVYVRILRNNLPDFFRVLDFPDPHALSAKRYVTTAPTQALLFMNSPYVIEQARRWAERLLEQTGKSDGERVEAAYWAAFARPCAAAERERALAFLREYDAALALIEPDAGARREKAWQGFCHAILQSTEFRFLD